MLQQDVAGERGTFPIDWHKIALLLAAFRYISIMNID